MVLGNHLVGMIACLLAQYLIVSQEHSKIDFVNVCDQCKGLNTAD
jgi:hypothetical protein